MQSAPRLGLQPRQRAEPRRQQRQPSSGFRDWHIGQLGAAGCDAALRHRRRRQLRSGFRGGGRHHAGGDDHTRARAGDVAVILRSGVDEDAGARLGEGRAGPQARRRRGGPPAAATDAQRHPAAPRRRERRRLRARRRRRWRRPRQRGALGARRAGFGDHGAADALAGGGPRAGRGRGWRARGRSRRRRCRRPCRDSRCCGLGGDPGSTGRGWD
mmetsp:Transcript_11167/g.39569  ORF Transcript_11167/g.39569 Transcript_11167/m.39569 type:complete len:214 (-) Transcript_11167:154-795(-)